MLTVVRRDGPILGKGPAPNAEVEDLHDDEADADVGRDHLDRDVLAQTHAGMC